jgi:hypothetical protein
MEELVCVARNGGCAEDTYPQEEVLQEQAKGGELEICAEH